METLAFLFKTCKKNEITLDFSILKELQTIFSINDWKENIKKNTTLIQESPSSERSSVRTFSRTSRHVLFTGCE
jgi:hypothetical protein